MIFSQILISLKSEKDLSWITKSEQQMTEQAEAIWKAPKSDVLRRSTKKFQHE